MQRVAKEAGVSTTTVFRVVNGGDGVSPQTVERVRKAMGRTGYKPRQRRKNRAIPVKNAELRNVVLLAIGEKERVFHYPVIAMALESLQSELASRGGNLMVSRIEVDARELPPTLSAGHADGVILMGEDIPEALVPKMRRVPAVRLFAGQSVADLWYDCVMPDHLSIGRLAADYLLRKNAKRVAMLRFVSRHAGNDIRFFALKRELNSRGADAVCISDDVDVELASPDPQVIDRLVTKVLNVSPRPDGLFIPTDLMTPFFIEQFSRRGVVPGKDIHLVTCNNKPASQIVGPRPASIDLNPEAMARRAVDQLIWRCEQGPEATHVTVLVSPRLIEEQSGAEE